MPIRTKGRWWKERIRQIRKESSIARKKKQYENNQRRKKQEKL